IYFDYNVPVVTNQTFHTVGRDFIQVNLISEVKNVKFNVKDVKIFPNPFRDKTQVIVESDPLKDAVLLLMNLEGSILKTIPSTGNTFDIYREDLASGMYIFKILQSKETIATGKLVVQ
ncbi:MAG: hypothetical protein JWN78_242, partial [Bacteroidota bacterium]|nr:hypothetical protein [Bacteroidota bacterium]